MGSGLNFIISVLPAGISAWIELKLMNKGVLVINSAYLLRRKICRGLITSKILIDIKT